MADTSSDHTGTSAPARMPRWVKGFVIAVMLVAIAAVAVQILGGAGHGPARHQPETVPAEVPSTVHTPPVDHG